MAANGEVAVGEAVDALILRQLEFYFSPSNVLQDKFLQQQMDREGFVPVALVASFKKMAALIARHPRQRRTSQLGAVPAQPSPKTRRRGKHKEKQQQQPQPQQQGAQSRGEGTDVASPVAMLLRMARASSQLEVGVTSKARRGRGSVDAAAGDGGDSRGGADGGRAVAAQLEPAVRSKTALADMRDDSLPRKVFVETAGFLGAAAQPDEKVGEGGRGTGGGGRGGGGRGPGNGRTGAAGDGKQQQQQEQQQPQQLDHEILAAAFEDAGFGRVLHVSMPRDRATRQFRGFAFVEFATETAAEAAAAQGYLRGLRVMSKREWLRLKGEYGQLVASSVPRVGVSKMRQQHRAGSSNVVGLGGDTNGSSDSRRMPALSSSSSSSSSPSSSSSSSSSSALHPSQSLAVASAALAGSVVRVSQLGPSTTRKALRAACQLAAPVSYVEYGTAGAPTALVRFKTRMGATLAVRHFKKAPRAFGGAHESAVVERLPAAEEAQYLAVAIARKEEFFRSQQQKRQTAAAAAAPAAAGGSGGDGSGDASLTRRSDSSSGGGGGGAGSGSAAASGVAGGTVLRIANLGPAATRKAILALCRTAAEPAAATAVTATAAAPAAFAAPVPKASVPNLVSYVDYAIDGAPTALVRFRDAGAAARALQHFRAQPSLADAFGSSGGAGSSGGPVRVQPLPAPEERQYHELARQRREAFFRKQQERKGERLKKRKRSKLGSGESDGDAAAAAGGGAVGAPLGGARAAPAAPAGAAPPNKR